MYRWASAALITAVLAGLMQLVTILGAAPAWACSCAGPMTDADHYVAADVVFTGAVTERIEPLPRPGGAKRLPAVLGEGHEPDRIDPLYEAPADPRHAPDEVPPVPIHPLKEPFENTLRAVMPWVASVGAGLLLLAVPGWLTVRARRLHAIVAEESEDVRVWRADDVDAPKRPR